MRRALAWMTGLIGVAALARLLGARRRSHARPVEPAEGHAEDLRRTIAASREAEAMADPEPDPQPEREPEASVDERRAEVHARAEGAIARMREGDG